jgi:methylase of polypeptide subunit release factors
MTHVLFTRAVGGNLYTAPIDKDKVQKILDIGTGTGTCRYQGRNSIGGFAADLKV